MHLTAGGHRIECRLIEPEGAAGRQRPTLVLLHEGLGSVAMWKDFPDALAARTQQTVLIYSRYGHGRSAQLTQSRPVDYMHDEATVVLPEILQQLDIRNPVLVGHSDGASIAIIHAGSGYPVCAMVLMAPHVFVEDVTIESIAHAKHTFETTDLSAKLGRYHDHPDSMFRGWNDIWSQPEFRDWNIENFLAEIHSPLLLVQSDNDPYGTLAQIDAIERGVIEPGVIESGASGMVSKLILPDCGHSRHVDGREETIDAIVNFVSKLDV